MQLAKAARIILVGAPGVGMIGLTCLHPAKFAGLTVHTGKGTQAERLRKRFPQLSAISSGDLLRDNVRNKTPLGKIWYKSCLALPV